MSASACEYVEVVGVIGVRRTRCFSSSSFPCVRACVRARARVRVVCVRMHACMCVHVCVHTWSWVLPRTTTVLNSAASSTRDQLLPMPGAAMRG